MTRPPVKRWAKLLPRPERSIAHLLVLHCAPLLAGMKVSQLLTTDRYAYCKIARLVCGTGIAVRPLLRTSNGITFLLYDPVSLKTHIGCDLHASFLQAHGYTDLSVEKVLAEVSRRYRLYQSGLRTFPHELGILLGYPLHDVIGFIEHAGQNCIFCGYWKVYALPAQKKKLFRSFDLAREEFAKRLQNGAGIRDILADRARRMYPKTA